MANNIIGKFVIELDENDRKLLERFVSAVDLMQGPTMEITRPNVRFVGLDACGRPQFEKDEETYD